MDTSSEEWRRICEARFLLRPLRGKPKKEVTASVGAIVERIAQKRGGQAAEELREEMRKQRARKGEWK